MREAGLLNLDLLGLICDATDDVSTVLSLSLVSHAVRAVAVKRLLSMKPVMLKDERTIRAFHQFVFADADSRLPFLRALNISVTNIVEEQARQEVVKCLLDLLEGVTRLKYLTLPNPRWTLDNLEDSRIPEAIARLSTLRELCLGSDSDEMAAIVRSTRSASCLRVLRLSLSSLPSTRGFGHGVKIGDLDECLIHLAPTLEVLILGLTTGTIQFDTKGAQYPALRSLTTCVESGLTRMDILVHKFPALDGTLDIRSMAGELHNDEPKQQRIRASNQEEQKRRSWRHLDCVKGDVFALFVLGLTCPVRRLMVDGFQGHKKNQLVEILRSSPPTHLKLSVILDHDREDDDDDNIFQDLFPPEVLPRLTHLVLLFDYAVSVHDNDSDEDDVKSMRWSAMLTEIIGSISALHLTHLRLVVHYSIDMSDEDAELMPYSREFVRDTVNINYQHLATELMHAIPSLEHIFVSTGGEFTVLVVPPGEKIKHLFGYYTPKVRTRGRWFAHSAWRNGRGGTLGAVTPERLNKNVMERMLLDEDLTLSDIDNFLMGFHKTWSEDETAPWPLPE